MQNAELRIEDTKFAAEYFLDVLTGTAYQIVLLGVEQPMGDKAVKERTERALNFLLKAFAIRPTAEA